MTALYDTFSRSIWTECLNRVKVSHDTTSLWIKQKKRERKKGARKRERVRMRSKNDLLTWPVVVGILLTARVWLPLWMMVLMVATVSPLPRQMHAHVHRMRPVTWKQIKGMPRQCLSTSLSETRKFQHDSHLMRVQPQSGLSPLHRNCEGKKFRTALLDHVIIPPAKTRTRERQMLRRMKGFSCFPGWD